jgi:hypothetical protein
MFRGSPIRSRIGIVATDRIGTFEVLVPIFLR